ncbi:MAG TPA: TonB C-terminal domain-containing protein [Terracidiphilus sp.]|jgi:protein TonB
MSSYFQLGEHLQQELAPEPFARPAAGSVLLHCGVVIAIVLYGVIGGFFHHNFWGGAGPGGAIQVNITNSLPIPSDHPPNQNVLATEKPSEAPAPPEPKAKQAQDEDAIPIQGKPKKPQQQETKHIPPQQQPVPQNRAQYGEQAGSVLPHTMAQGAGGPTTVTDANFGNLFGWYVDNINRKMEANGYRSLADPHTPKGVRAYISFNIARDGSISQVRLDRSSGSATWDSVCVRAAQRVDTFGGLPAQYRGSNLMVSYYCEY